MRIFVTGASGWIGSAVVPELVAAGHQVLGLARSDGAAQLVTDLGAEVHRGDLDDVESLRLGAAACDGVVHLGYNHDFSDMAAAAQTDLAAIDAMGSALAGTGGPLLIASGVVGLTDGRVAVETDQPDLGTHPRVAGARSALAFADRGRAPRRHPIPTDRARAGRPRVHRHPRCDRPRAWRVGIRRRGRQPLARRSTALDAAALVRIAVDDTAAGPAIHATAEAGIPTRTIAEAIGRGLGLAVTSIAQADAQEHFGWIGRFFAADVPASSAMTQRQLRWTPTHPGLIDDIDAGYYFHV